MEKQNNKKVNAWKILTFLILFVLPLGSVVFLTKGRTHRRTAISELKDKGGVAEFQAHSLHDEMVSSDFFHGKVAVVNFLSANNEKAKKQADRIAMLHQSFDDTKDVLFLSFISMDSSINLIQKANKLGIKDHEQWFLLGTEEKEWRHYSHDVFKIENPENGLVLLDTSLTIRHYYDIFSDPEMGRLVEHITVVIPQQKRRGF